MKINEKNLIEKSKNGDTHAFGQLIRVHEKKIYNLLLNMTHNQAVADDLLQETFLAAWQKLKYFRGDSEISTWLYRIATNFVLMKKRKKKMIHTVSMDAPIVTVNGEKNRTFSDL